MDIGSVLEATAVACLVSLCLMLALPPVARAIGLIDRPGGHKTHEGEVPVIGGLAIFAGLGVAAACGAPLGQHAAPVLLAASLMVVVGAIDDRFEIPPVTRLLAQLAAAIALVSGTGFTVSDFGDLLGTGVIKLWPLSTVFTVIATVALINAFNMLDGLDGLAGGAALCGFVGLAITAFHAGAATSATIAACMAGAVSGFLFFNAPVRINRELRAFMGDAGSTLLGFILAAVALALVQTNRANVPPVLILWMVPIPIFELFSTTFRRLFGGLSPMAPDNGHFHHRLLAAGLSVRAIFYVYLVVSAAAVTLGTVAYRLGTPEPALFGLFVAGYTLWLLAMRNLNVVVRWIPFRRRTVDATVN